MVQVLRDFLTLFAPLVAIGIFLNSIAPIKYKNQIQSFFENPARQLNGAIAAFVGSTFHRVFGEKILTKSFFLTSIAFSLWIRNLHIDILSAERGSNMQISSRLV
jgi:hypothetical protein